MDSKSSLSPPPSPLYPPIVLDTYYILVEPGCITSQLSSPSSSSSLATRIHSLCKSSKYVIITDTNVSALYLSTVTSSFHTLISSSPPSSPNPFTVHSFIIPSGESSKCRFTLHSIEDFLLSLPCGRDTTLIALGGGVVGDIVGLASSTYMRGISLIHIPTTLLAMVDSSIGGKTAIDHPKGKNLIGTFYRPLAVIIDPLCLLSLPMREVKNGLAESLKMGCIMDEKLFFYIEKYGEEMVSSSLSSSIHHFTHIIYHSAKLKAEVVMKDEKESGIRAILNYGHTIGHAVESIKQPLLLHGECVSIGMVSEGMLSYQMGNISYDDVKRVERAIKSIGLPLEIPSDCELNDMMVRMAIDKKNKGGKKEFVMLSGVGKVKEKPYTTMVQDEILLHFLSPSISLIPSLSLSSPSISPPPSVISVPGSKSLSNRILLLAAMGIGECRIKGLLQSDDTMVMMESLTTMGVKMRWEMENNESQKTLIVMGCEGKLTCPSPSFSLYLGNAGTASRFLTTLCTLLPSSSSVTLSGSPRLHDRPISDLVDTLITNGQKIEYLRKEKEKGKGNGNGCFPIQMTSIGGLKGGELRLRANISSQYVSSILLSAPFASSEITLILDESEGKSVVSEPFIAMTIQLMKQFNIEIHSPHPHHYTITRGNYHNPPVFYVEGDATSASYPLAFAAVNGRTVTVSNVGALSLQGDSKFCNVLKEMGCVVEQTERTTTVTGPTAELRGISIDLNDMTDCFMTLAAVSVFSQGVTHITNISNQRVKECNRISAMVKELGKIGIDAKETESGISIVGVGNIPSAWPVLPFPTPIDCYDDHRIAMSFAVIGSRMKNINITQKRCVDKTYPTFWEDIEKQLLIKTTYGDNMGKEERKRGGEGKGEGKDSLRPSETQFPTVILVGMRGVGKSTLGSSCSHHLHRQFIDMDALIESQIHMSVKDFVEHKGWESFRMMELQVLTDLLSSRPFNTVIACGGGIVETPRCRFLLSSPSLLTIQIHRHIDDIMEYLDKDRVRPSFDAKEAWTRREPLYRLCAKFKFQMRKGDREWGKIEEEFDRFVALLTGDYSVIHAPLSIHPPSRSLSPSSPPFSYAHSTFFLSLTYPDISSAIPLFPSLLLGVDAVELRVDLLSSHTEDYIVDQLAILRRHCHLPIIYTVRTLQQGGKMVATSKELLTMYSIGIRYGCEYIDVEMDSSSSNSDILSFVKSYSRFPLSLHKHFRFIGSHHIISGNGGNDNDVEIQMTKLTQTDGIDIAKYVVTATHHTDGLRISQIASRVLSTSPIPLISLAMGEKGKISRVLNTFFTPVTHPLLPTSAAPGQLSVEEIQKFRVDLGLLSPSQFYLFGSPIGKSPSPLMHNTAFTALSLPFQFSLCETNAIDMVKQTLSQRDTLGASVTIPLKELVFPLMDSVSESAKVIKSINTIVKREDGTVYGDNTDWKGAFTLLRRALKSLQQDERDKNERKDDKNISSPSPPSSSSDFGALVIGAGGTSRALLYSLNQLGFKGKNLKIYNRTEEKASAMAKEFSAVAIHSLTPLEFSDPPVRIIISTLPPSASFTLPSPVISSLLDNIILFDVTYIPYESPIIHQFSSPNTKNKNIIIRGIDLLLAQGREQMEIWTRRSASVANGVEKIVRKKYMEEHGTKE